MGLSNKDVHDAVGALVLKELSSEHNELCPCNVCLAKKSNDIIKWPKHYNTSSIQPIDAIEAWKLDFRLANAVKYLARAGKKDPNKLKEDLEKAVWYIQRYIDKECNNDKKES